MNKILRVGVLIGAVVAMAIPSAALGAGSVFLGAGSGPLGAEASLLSSWEGLRSLPVPRDGETSVTIGSPLLTLADVARREPNELIRASNELIASWFYKGKHWITATSAHTVDSAVVKGPYAAKTPVPSRVLINQALGQKGVDLGTHEAHASFMGDEFVVQKMLKAQPGLASDLQMKLELYVTGAVQLSNWDFIAGNPALDPAQAAGLDYRIANPDFYKLKPIVIDLKAKNGAAVVNVDSGLTVDKAKMVTRALDDVFADLGAPGGAGCVIFTNRHAVGALPSVLREAKKNVFFEKAPFGTGVDKYGEALIWDLGDKPGVVGGAIADSVIPAAGDGSSPLYVVNFNRFKPWQTNALTVMPAPQLSNLFDRYEFFWGCGALEASPYCVAKITGIKWRD